MGKVDSTGPHIKVGAAVPYDLTTRDTLYPVYHAKSKERLILTGMVNNGDSEDIVVFSDAYFQKLEKKVRTQLKEAPSPTRLVTLQAPKNELPDISRTINAFLKKNAAASHLNPADFPCYAKNTELPAAIGERFFKEVGYLVTALILMLSTLFLFYLKYSMEIDDMTHRSQLLKIIGMNPEERKKLLHAQMRTHSLATYLTAVILSAIFWLALPVTRLFHAKETILYYVVFILIAVIYTLVYGFGMHLLEKHFVKIALAEPSASPL